MAQVFKVPRPPVYNGQRDIIVLNDFLSRMELYFDHCGVPEDIKVRSGRMYLTGPAMRWTTAYLAGATSETDWNVFKSALTNAFIDTVEKHQVYKLLHEVKQTGTVLDYTAQFRTTDRALLNATTSTPLFAQAANISAGDAMDVDALNTRQSGRRTQQRSKGKKSYRPTRRRGEITCWNCGKRGHREAECTLNDRNRY